VGSLANSPANQLLRLDSERQNPTQSEVGEGTDGSGSCGSRTARLAAGAGAGGIFFSALNHFQDCSGVSGEAYSRRLPQQRPNVVLLLNNTNTSHNQDDQSQTMYNFALPFWSFLHRHASTDRMLPTENSAALDCSSQPLHSLFTALCETMLFLLRKTSYLCELDAIKESDVSVEMRERRSGVDSSLLEPVAATLRVLLALENKVKHT
jgi:hypothetical protein